MLRLLRTRTWCLVTAVLLAAGTTAATFGELLHAGASHDTACLSLGDAEHDSSRHRVDVPVEADAADDHCVGCHLARAPRIGQQRVSYSPHTHEGRPPRPVVAIGSARAAALDNLPPRSPPHLG